MATHCIDLWNQKRINLVAATKQSAQIFLWTCDNMTIRAQLHLWFDSNHYYKNFLQKHKFRACGSKFRAIHLHSIQKIRDFVRKFFRVLTFDCEFMFSIVWGGILRHFRQVCFIFTQVPCGMYETNAPLHHKWVLYIPYKSIEGTFLFINKFWFQAGLCHRFSDFTFSISMRRALSAALAP